MPFGQHRFVNDQDRAIYITIEPTPDCYELEPGDQLTLIVELPKSGDAFDVRFLNDRELLIDPVGIDFEPVVLINGASAEGRSWKFKHR